ncbi:hypothetical protein ABEX78_23020 [Priestia megaterium]
MNITEVLTTKEKVKGFLKEAGEDRNKTELIIYIESDSIEGLKYKFFDDIATENESKIDQFLSNSVEEIRTRVLRFVDEAGSDRIHYELKRYVDSDTIEVLQEKFCEFFDAMDGELESKWEETDPRKRWTKQLNKTKFNVIEVFEDTYGYVLQDVIVDLQTYTDEQLDNYVSGFYDNVEHLKEGASEGWRWWLAEVIAQQVPRNDKTDKCFDKDIDLYKYLKGTYDIELGCYHCDEKEAFLETADGKNICHHCRSVRYWKCEHCNMLFDADNTCITPTEKVYCITDAPSNDNGEIITPTGEIYKEEEMLG